MNGLVYLDNNATTRVAPECLPAIMDALERYGNPSSKHGAGESAKGLILEARAKVASLLNASPAEIVFTSGGTESNHTAILGALESAGAKRHIISSQVEHPSTLGLLKHLESRGYAVTNLPVDANGAIDLQQLCAAINEHTALVTLMWANNETGVVFPIAEAAQIAADRNVPFHTDAVQAVGKTAIDMKSVPVDFLSFSGHKVHAAKGIGALFVRKGRKFGPLLFGHQERARRGGTENLPGIASLGVACELAGQALLAETPKIKARRDHLERELLARIADASVNGAGGNRLGGTASVCLGEIEAEPVLDKLDRMGICASAGAACTASGTEPSHVLTAMGLSTTQALATIRFSLSRYTTDADIERVIEVLPGVVNSILAEAA